MASSLTAEELIPYALLGMTAVTGLADAVSFLSLGCIFTENAISLLQLLPLHRAGTS